jgi:hypothetical protein
MHEHLGLLLMDWSALHAFEVRTGTALLSLTANIKPRPKIPKFEPKNSELRKNINIGSLMVQSLGLGCSRMYR